LYFVTLTVAGWVDVFTRPQCKDLLIRNLQYCQVNEGLLLYEYVIMTNHMHMIASRDNEQDLSQLLGRFKSYTAKELLKLIKANPEESRKDWLFYLFEFFSKINSQHGEHNFWQYTNHPVELYSNEVIDQKVDYIHMNPVKVGFVAEPHEYVYSSASRHSPLKTLEL
jgi:REP element-mobilizing transposase RayT